LIVQHEPLRLADLLSPRRVRLPLRASSLVEAAEKLGATLVTDHAPLELDALRERIEEARPEDIVGLGDRAFVLHYRTDAARDLCVAIGIAPKPLCRDLGDDDGSQCARIVVLVCSPPRQMARHLQVVGTFARALAKPAMIDAILAAEDAVAIAALPQFHDAVLPEQLTVRDLMTERPRTVGPDASLRSAVMDMLRAGVGGLPVVDDGDRVVGMLSERELLRDLVSHYLPRAGGAVASPPPPASVRRTVRDAMTRQVLCVAPEQPLAEVASLMLNKDVERVPVVKEGKLVGFLTRGDIVRKLIGF
jgi:CBS domain-containing protein/mannitol/fructose-specific phosphotransferase system IIA component (Ntr-type)